MQIESNSSPLKASRTCPELAEDSGGVESEVKWAFKRGFQRRLQFPEAPIRCCAALPQPCGPFLVALIALSRVIPVLGDSESEFVAFPCER